MRRALGPVVFVLLLVCPPVAFAEGHTSTADPLGLAPLEEMALAKISGRDVVRPGASEPSRVILWDEAPPKSNRGGPSRAWSQAGPEPRHRLDELNP